MKTSQFKKNNDPSFSITKYFGFAKLWIAFVVLSHSLSIRGQGTIKTGFEEYAVGSVPSFVTFHGLATQVADSKTWLIPPFEGDKFLLANNTVILESPDGQPMQAFTARLFIRTPPPGSGVIILVGSQQEFVSQFDSWQTIQRTFGSPAQSLTISITYPGFEGISIPYGIDNIEFTTVPEPQTFWLVTLGLGAILLRRSKSLKAKSR